MGKSRKKKKPVSKNKSGQASKAQNILASKFAPKTLLLLLPVVLLMAILITNSKVRDANSDPILILVTSKAILEDGTIKLDRFRKMNLEQQFGGIWDKHHAWLEHNGHFYNFYPIGASLVALPFVAVARLAGWDVLTHNAVMQKVLAMLACVFTYIMLFVILRRLVTAKSAFVISTIVALGSSLISSNGTALWTHTVSVCVFSFAIYLLIRAEQDGEDSLNPYLLGSLLFFAYLTRPSSSLFILSVFIFMIIRSRHNGTWVRLIKTAATAAGLLLLYVGFNMVELGLPLPPYYLLFRDKLVIDRFFTAFLGLTISPSRGMFIFSPFLIVVMAGVILSFRKLRHDSLFVMMAAWSTMHFLLICFFVAWPGGWSYGPRLLVDILPALAVIAALAWRECSRQYTGKSMKVAMVLFVALGILSIHFHSNVGLFNKYSQAWNSVAQKEMDLTKDRYGIYFRWSHAQPLADKKMLVNWNYDIARIRLGSSVVDAYIEKYGALPGLPPPIK